MNLYASLQNMCFNQKELWLSLLRQEHNDPGENKGAQSVTLADIVSVAVL